MVTNLALGGKTTTSPLSSWEGWQFILIGKESYSGYGFAFPDHRAPISATSGTSPDAKAKNSTRHSIPLGEAARVLLQDSLCLLPVTLDPCVQLCDPDQQDAGLLLRDGGRKEYECNAGDRRAPPGNAHCSRERTGMATLTREGFVYQAFRFSVPLGVKVGHATR